MPVTGVNPNIYTNAAKLALDQREAANRERDAQSLNAERQQQILESQQRMSTSAAEQRTKAEAAAKTQQEQAAAQQVYQQYGSDPEQLVIHLRTAAPTIAAQYEKQRDESRKSAAEAADKELTNTGKRIEIGAGIWRRADATPDEASFNALYTAGRNLMVDNHELPPNVTREQLKKLIEGTQNWKQVADEHRAAMKDLADGNWQVGIAKGLLVADSPEDRQGFLEYAASQGAPRALLEMLSTKSPEELKAATMTPNEQADNATAAGQLAVAQRGATTAEGNLAVRKQEANKPTSESGGAFSLSPGQSRYDAKGNLVATAPEKAGGTGAETAQDRQRMARTNAARQFLGRLNELRESINTKMGPAAGVTGLARRGLAATGWDPDVAEYERERAAGGRALAVAVMGAQNLSDADAKAWADMLPGATVDKETAQRLMKQVETMLENSQDGSAGAPPLAVSHQQGGAKPATSADGWTDLGGGVRIRKKAN